ncbi:MAG TPA: GNAT family N-acetyltransferase [Micromonosporaceae bacterium]|nr:GNAT family N-acetyltransferase [Micromonosporaceae bacterium]
MPQEIQLHVASFAELDLRTLYELLRLRVDVFVVEQECAYPELDGRDTEPGTRHLWLEKHGVPVAYLRLLDDGAVQRIGRVAVTRNARGRGFAARLMAQALAIIGPMPCVLDAQTYLVDFYAGFDFLATGPEYVEDGIPHLPMRRDPAVPAPQSGEGGPLPRE